MIMNSPRLKEQGFSNLHRKLIFRIIAIGLIAYLLMAPDQLHISPIWAFIGQIAGMLAIFIGIIGRILATLSIGGKKDSMIVKTELYSICRNPLYFASFLISIGLGLVSTRMDFTILILISFFIIFFPMMLNEAKVLRSKFEDYRDYETRVPLFIPNFLLWKQREVFEINFRRVIRTFLDASLVLLCLPVFIWLAIAVQHEFK